MPTCYNHKLALLHIPKCGGMSLTDYYKRTLPNIELCSHRHIPVHQLYKFTGKTPESFEKIIAVVRNPYVQQVSQWSFWRQEYEAGKRGPDFDTAHALEFKEWVKHPESNFAVKDLWPQFGGVYRYWCCDEQGEIPDNLEIVPLENLNKLMELLAPYQVFKAPIPHKNRSKHNFYKTYYDKETAAVVTEKFKWIFDNTTYRKSCFCGNKKRPKGDK